MFALPSLCQRCLGNAAHVPCTFGVWQRQLELIVCVCACAQGTREQAKRTQQDRARVAKRKEAEAVMEARNKKKLEEFLKEAMRSGMLKKKKKPG